MKRNGLYIGVCIIAAMVLTCLIYVFIGTKNTDKLMQEYFKEKGFSTDEIHSIDVKHSFLNVISSYNEWNIYVQYADETDAIYIYTVQNGQIKEAGVSGSVDKEDLKHIKLK